jgi:uncharacterized protein (TIGR02594 family)
MKFWEWLKSLFAAKKSADIVLIRPIENVAPVPLKPPPQYEATPWIDWMRKRIGWSEDKNDAQLAVYWKYVGFSSWKTVVGREHAWCAMCVNAALIESGYKGNGRADAVSFVKYGVPCALKLWCIVVIQHSNGGHHVAFYAGDNKTFGGNQDDMICIKPLAPTDRIIACRWPIKDLK